MITQIGLAQLDLIVALILLLILILVCKEIISLVRRCGVDLPLKTGLPLLSIGLIIQLLIDTPTLIPLLMGNLAIGIVVLQNTKFPLKMRLLSGAILLTLMGYFTFLYQVILVLLKQEWRTELGIFYLMLVIRDTTAGFYGKFFNGTMITDLSPRKTWQGAVFGLITMSIFWLAITPKLGQSRESAILQGVILGITGQVGDLVVSAIKRAANVKHSSTMFGERGGLLDMFDSAIFSLPFWYAYHTLV